MSSVGVSSAWKGLAKIGVGVGGAYKNVVAGYVGVGGAWKLAFSVALAGVAAPTSLSGSGSHPALITTTASTTCTASGGTPGYTYAWTYVSGDGSIAPTATSSATTSFQRFCVAAGTFNAVFKCVVTDSLGAHADSNTVSISITAS
jgi:hypothetical protein